MKYFSENAQSELVLKTLNKKYSWIVDVEILPVPSNNYFIIPISIIMNPSKFITHYGYEPIYNFEKEMRGFKKNSDIKWSVQELFYLFRIPPAESYELKKNLQVEIKKLFEISDKLIPSDSRMKRQKHSNFSISSFNLDLSNRDT